MDLFASYSHRDRATIRPIVEELTRRGLSVWFDAANLQAGVVWEHAILKALTEAKALVAFLSDFGVRSGWIMQEIDYALENNIRIIPVLIGTASLGQIPARVARYQLIDLTNVPTAELADRAAREIERAFKQLEHRPENRGFDVEEAGNLARHVSREAKSFGPDPDAAESARPNSIFIVHGHDEDMLVSVCEYLINLSIRPIVLRDMDSGAGSLLERFFEFGEKATSAIVLLSADDYGASVSQFDSPGVADRSLQFRARQNVILELGYFYGQLGWDKVYVLERRPPRPYPNFERPSDLGGRVFNQYDDRGLWRGGLSRYLDQTGFSVPTPPGG